MVRTVLEKKAHTVNGKFYGWWIKFSDGECAYVAYRKGSGSRGHFRLKNAWCFDLSVLNDAKHRGVKTIMVVHDRGKKQRDYYATPLQMLLEAPSEPHAEGATRQRRLALRLWIVNPSRNAETIAKSLKLR